MVADDDGWLLEVLAIVVDVKSGTRNQTHHKAEIAAQYLMHLHSPAFILSPNDTVETSTRNRPQQGCNSND